SSGGSSDLSFDLRVVVTVEVELPPGGEDTGTDGSGGGVDTTAGGPGPGGDSGASGLDPGTAGLGSSGGAPTAGAAGDGGGGCGCVAHGRGSGPALGWGLGGLLLLLGRRRRLGSRRGVLSHRQPHG